MFIGASLELVTSFPRLPAVVGCTWEWKRVTPKDSACPPVGRTRPVASSRPFVGAALFAQSEGVRQDVFML